MAWAESGSVLSLKVTAPILLTHTHTNTAEKPFSWGIEQSASSPGCAINCHSKKKLKIKNAHQSRPHKIFQFNSNNWQVQKSPIQYKKKSTQIKTFNFSLSVILKYHLRNYNKKNMEDTSLWQNLNLMGSRHGYRTDRMKSAQTRFDWAGGRHKKYITQKWVGEEDIPPTWHWEVYKSRENRAPYFMGPIGFWCLDLNGFL